jgi:3-hydroxyisobutyrate dehydrogenase-like beta-hydroxyacid dehydrogenase
LRSFCIAHSFAAEHSGRVSVASTPAEVVGRCGTTYSMLSTLDASRAVVCENSFVAYQWCLLRMNSQFDSPTGVISGVTSGKTIIDCATLTPERMIEEARRIREKGGLFLDAPVAGSTGPAKTGALVFLCSGDEAAFKANKAALDVMSKASYFFGDAGQGTKVKLVVNMIMGTVMSAYAEGLALAESAGLPGFAIQEVRREFTLLTYIYI